MTSDLDPRLERRETDESLRDERERTDDELRRRETSLGKVTDAVVDKAQLRARDKLEVARHREDEKRQRDNPPKRDEGTLGRQRAQEDKVLASEEVTFKDAVLAESRDRTRALSQLLRLERERTDERLLIERARGDAGMLARDDFMGMATHDLRTLLGAIALTLETQARSRPPTDDATAQRELRTSQRLQHLTARMNRLIGDLVDVSAIEAGRFTVTPANHELAALLHGSMEAFMPAAVAKGVVLRTSGIAAGLSATFDDERILQVLANLISNAIKFTPRGGEVTLGLEEVEGALRFAVADTGPGIAQEHLEAIFERFWQVKEGDRRGRGLGLFISRRIVEAHGGLIWAQSEEGRGSTFFFTLPPASNAAM